jgi:hypothetical protein
MAKAVAQGEERESEKPATATKKTTKAATSISRQIQITIP